MAKRGSQPLERAGDDVTVFVDRDPDGRLHALDGGFGGVYTGGELRSAGFPQTLLLDDVVQSLRQIAPRSTIEFFVHFFISVSVS